MEISLRLSGLVRPLRAKLLARNAKRPTEARPKSGWTLEASVSRSTRWTVVTCSPAASPTSPYYPALEHARGRGVSPACSSRVQGQTRSRRKLVGQAVWGWRYRALCRSRQSRGIASSAVPRFHTANPGHRRGRGRRFTCGVRPLARGAAWRNPRTANKASECDRPRLPGHRRRARNLDPPNLMAGLP